MTWLPPARHFDKPPHGVSFGRQQIGWGLSWERCEHPWTRFGGRVWSA